MSLQMAIKRMKTLRGDGYTQAETARVLNKEGHVTKKGKKWNANNVCAYEVGRCSTRTRRGRKTQSKRPANAIKKQAPVISAIKAVLGIDLDYSDKVRLIGKIIEGSR